MQLNRGERIDKVEQTVGEIAGDYERLLRGLEARKNMVILFTDDGEREREKRRGKRKVIVIEDEDEDDLDYVGAGSAKRWREMLS